MRNKTKIDVLDIIPKSYQLIALIATRTHKLLQKAISNFSCASISQKSQHHQNLNLETFLSKNSSAVDAFVEIYCFAFEASDETQMKSDHSFLSLWVTRQLSFFYFIIAVPFQIKLNSWHWKRAKIGLHIKSDIRSIPTNDFNRENCKLESQTFKVLDLPKFISTLDLKHKYV